MIERVYRNFYSGVLSSTPRRRRRGIAECLKISGQQPSRSWRISHEYEPSPLRVRRRAAAAGRCRSLFEVGGCGCSGATLSRRTNGSWGALYCLSLNLSHDTTRLLISRFRRAEINFSPGTNKFSCHSFRRCSSYTNRIHE